MANLIAVFGQVIEVYGVPDPEQQLQKGGKSAGSAFKECPTDSCYGQVVEAVVEKGLRGRDFKKTIYEVPEDVRRELAKKVSVLCDVLHLSWRHSVEWSVILDCCSPGK